MISFNLINPYIRVAMHSILPENFFIKQRIIYDYELIYIEKGKLYFYYAGKKYTCNPGQFIFIRPGISHEFICGSEPVYQPHIHFDMVYNLNSEKTSVSYKDMNELSAEEKKLITKDIFEEYSKTPFVVFSNKEKVFELFYSIVNSQNNAKGLQYKARLTEIISMLISDNFPDFFSEQNTEKYTVFHQVKDYIDAGQGLSMSLDDFEKQFSYSKFYLDRKFKKRFGVSIIEYRNQKRMQKACELLKAKISVTKVSEILGFSSVYSFSRTFKNETGVSPSDFIENINKL